MKKKKKVLFKKTCKCKTFSFFFYFAGALQDFDKVKISGAEDAPAPKTNTPSAEVGAAGGKPLVSHFWLLL